MSQSESIRRPARYEELQVRGLRHRLTWWGEPSAQPLVLLHGFKDSGLTWQFVVDHLPATWSCVAPDWRGFGGSDRAPAGYWFADYFADLDALLDALVPHHPARVVGHSMGGHIASLYAGIRPRRLSWLVNLEGMGLPRTSAAGAPARYREWMDQVRSGPRTQRYHSIEQLATLLRIRNPRLTPFRAGFIAEAWTRAVGDRRELAADPRHSLINPMLYRRDEAEACWRAVEVPVLLLIGEQSELRERLGSDGTDAYFQSIFQNIRIATLPGCGHMMQHEDPQGVADQIMEFARLAG